MQRMVRGRGGVRERRHGATRVRLHARPDAAVARARMTLAAAVVARLEHGGVEAGLERMLRGDEPAGPGPDDRHPCVAPQVQHPTLPPGVSWIPCGARSGWSRQQRWSRAAAAATAKS